MGIIQNDITVFCKMGFTYLFAIRSVSIAKLTYIVFIFEYRLKLYNKVSLKDGIFV